MTKNIENVSKEIELALYDAKTHDEIDMISTQIKRSLEYIRGNFHHAMRVNESERRRLHEEVMRHDRGY